MDSSVSPKDEIWLLRVCHQISNSLQLCPLLTSAMEVVFSFIPLSLQTRRQSSSAHWIEDLVGFGGEKTFCPYWASPSLRHSDTPRPLNPQLAGDHLPAIRCYVARGGIGVEKTSFKPSAAKAEIERRSNSEKLWDHTYVSVVVP